MELGMAYLRTHLIAIPPEFLTDVPDNTRSLRIFSSHRLLLKRKTPGLRIFEECFELPDIIRTGSGKIHL